MGNKIILAHILVKTVNVFYGMDPNDVASCIEADPVIGIANELSEHDEKYELHRLLSTLLSMDLSANEKLEIIEEEYCIPVDERMREDVNVMCNLSQGILEIGEARGEANIILSLYKNGYTVEQIASATGKKVEVIKAIVEKRMPVLV